MTTATRPPRLPEHLLSACGYFLPRLMFLNARYAPQVHWGDVTSTLSDFPADLVDMTSAAFWDEWRERWIARAEEYVLLAKASSTRAGQSRAMRSAAACYHWAEFMEFEDQAEKLTLRQAVRDCFEASWTDDVRLTSGEVEVGGGQSNPVPFWVLTPSNHNGHNSTPLPCVVVSNGLDSMTEVEILALAETYLERGLAAVLFEGPGQGLGVGLEPLRLDMEVVIAAILDRLRENPQIDSDHLAFAGVSFGGYFALRVAQTLPERFRCVVNLSGGPRIAAFDTLPRRLKEDFRFALKPGVTPMQDIFDRLGLDVSRPIDTDVLSVHGRLDDIFPLRHVEEMDRAWGSRHTLVVHDREAHVCLNQLNALTLQAADWVAERLTVGGRP
jgi:pimeloyl-ACP methyl ester carboxylesterase